MRDHRDFARPHCLQHQQLAPRSKLQGTARAIAVVQLWQKAFLTELLRDLDAWTVKNNALDAQTPRADKTSR